MMNTMFREKPTQSRQNQILARYINITILSQMEQYSSSVTVNNRGDLALTYAQTTSKHT